MRKFWKLKTRCAAGVMAWTFLSITSVSAAASGSVLETKLRSDVAMLAGTIGSRSLARPDALNQAADYIVQRLEAGGWTVKRLPSMVGLSSCENIEVEKRGSMCPEEIVVIGAHYDTVPQTPGADDNASGVAALLALAERFASATPERTLRFVAFVNEEPPYFQTDQMGSRVYARRCKANGDRVVATLALESIGLFRDEKKSQHYPFPLSLFYPSRGNFLAIVGNTDSKALVRRVKATIERSGKIPVESASLPGSLQGVGWSDHWSFWQEGYPAVMITDTAPFRNQHYHKRTDTVATLDYARLAAAVQALTNAVEDLLSSPRAGK